MFTILLCDEEEPASTPLPPTAIHTELPSSPTAVPIHEPQCASPKKGKVSMSPPPPTSVAATSTTSAPSSSKKQPTDHHYSTGAPTSHHSHANHWWVPSNILAAQGYYDGCTELWIPRRPSLKNRKQSKQSRVNNKPILQRWLVPDRLLRAQGFYEGNTLIWLPKHATCPRHQQTPREPRQRLARPPPTTTPASQKPTLGTKKTPQSPTVP